MAPLRFGIASSCGGGGGGFLLVELLRAWLVVAADLAGAVPVGAAWPASASLLLERAPEPSRAPTVKSARAADRLSPTFSMATVGGASCPAGSTGGAGGAAMPIGQTGAAPAAGITAAPSGPGAGAGAGPGTGAGAAAGVLAAESVRRSNDDSGSGISSVRVCTV